VAEGHCSLHLMGPPAARRLAEELAPDRLGTARFIGATLQFEAVSPPDPGLLESVVALRMAEVDARLDNGWLEGTCPLRSAMSDAAAQQFGRHARCDRASTSTRPRSSGFEAE
jgi:hypothetical protein